jgi:hypothetical protein
MIQGPSLLSRGLGLGPARTVSIVVRISFRETIQVFLGAHY